MIFQDSETHLGVTFVLYTILAKSEVALVWPALHVNYRVVCHSLYLGRRILHYTEAWCYFWCKEISLYQGNGFGFIWTIWLNNPRVSLQIWGYYFSFTPEVTLCIGATLKRSLPIFPPLARWTAVGNREPRPGSPLLQQKTCIQVIQEL